MAIRKGDCVPADLAGAGLYNLKDDIGEKNDVSTQHPQEIRALAAAWQTWNRTLAMPAWPPPPAGGRGAETGDPGR